MARAAGEASWRHSISPKAATPPTASQIGPNSHLLISGTPAPQFPGRGFVIETIAGMGKKELKRALAGVDRANIAVRNFPLTAVQLRRKLKLADGGDVYLFGTTSVDGRHVIVRTVKQ